MIIVEAIEMFKVRGCNFDHHMEVPVESIKTSKLERAQQFLASMKKNGHKNFMLKRIVKNGEFQKFGEVLQVHVDGKNEAMDDSLVYFELSHKLEDGEEAQLAKMFDAHEYTKHFPERCQRYLTN